MPNSDGYSRKQIIVVSIVLLAAVIVVGGLQLGEVTADAGGKPAVSASGEQQLDQDRPEQHTMPGVPTGSIVKMVSALVIVIFSIYFGVYLLKKFMGRRYGGGSRQKILEVLESTYVGPKKMVSLVRVADKSVLIGVTDQNISVLTELDAARTAELVAEETETLDRAAGFGGFLKAASDKIKEMGTKKDRAVLES